MFWSADEVAQLRNSGDTIYYGSVTTFDELVNCLRKSETQKGWLFRGQRKASWELMPSLYRGCNNSNPQGLATRHLEKFKIYARGRLPNTDSWGDARYWALGRHYGLDTPLLDWSASPFIALFFAFSEETNSDEARALYAIDASYINRELCRRIGKELLGDDELAATFEDRYGLHDKEMTEKEVMIGRVILDKYDSDLRPASDRHGQFLQFIDSSVSGFARLLSPKMGENPRLLSQRGVFTYQDTAEDLVSILGKSKNQREPIVSKLLVPNSLRSQILRYVNSMNINALSLFPDLEGASRYCNEKLREEKDEDVDDLNMNRIWV